MHYIYARERSPCTYDTKRPSVLSSIQQANRNIAGQIVMHERLKPSTKTPKSFVVQGSVREHVGRLAFAFYVPEN